jgi:hypothetical protein
MEGRRSARGLVGGGHTLANTRRGPVQHARPSTTAAFALARIKLDQGRRWTSGGGPACSLATAVDEFLATLYLVIGGQVQSDPCGPSGTT